MKFASKHLLPIVALSLSASPALARPLLDSDLPTDLQDMARQSVAPGKVAVRTAAAWDAQSETGEASFYRSSRRFHRTSSGELYNENGMTAAHNSLPLGTRVRVTRQDTGDSIVVRINDRSAGRGLRVIDLSYGAARQLGIHGVGMVSVSVLTPNNAGEPVEVAEAPEPGTSSVVTRDGMPHVIKAAYHHRHRHHRHHHGRSMAAASDGAHVRTASLTQHSVPPQGRLHRL